MRKLFLLLILSSFSLTASSQILLSILFGDKLNSDGMEFGLDIGMNISNLEGFSETTYSPSWNLGFGLDIRIKNQWSLSTGTRVKNTMLAKGISLAEANALGYDFITLEEATDYYMRMSQIQVPVLLRKRFGRIYLEAGGTAALNAASSMVKFYEVSGRQLLETIDNHSDMRLIEFGFSGGLGYDFSEGKGLVGGFRYYQSLTNAFHNYSPYRWRMYDFYVQFPIGASSSE